MKIETFNALTRGDIVKSASSGAIYIVSANYGGRVTAVNTVDMTNPVEWVLVVKNSPVISRGPVEIETVAPDTTERERFISRLKAVGYKPYKNIFGVHYFAQNETTSTRYAVNAATASYFVNGMHLYEKPFEEIRLEEEK